MDRSASQWRLLVGLLLTVVGRGLTKAQEIGTDLCACQPSVYEIVLDFDSTCGNSNVVRGPGIKETACTVEPPNADDMVIVEATTILISELDPDLQIIQQVNLTGTFENGDKATYESITAQDAGSLTPDTIPAGLQISVIGVNAEGTELINLWVVLFTNDCESYPVIESEMQIGWTVFESVTAPPAELCPISTTPPTITPVVCACQPGSYDIRLNFGLECADSTVEGPGIDEIACTVEPPNVDDPFVVEVSDIVITELDQDLRPIKEETMTGTFEDGEVLTYESNIADPEAITPTNIPGGLQISLTGVNAAGTELKNIWVVLFTNDCENYPVIESQMQIGWTVFDSVTPPPAEVCPIAAEPTGPPVLTPVAPPVEEPALTPVETPVKEPVAPPVLTPVKTPVEEPALAPVETPVKAPVGEPALAPVETPVESPDGGGLKPPTPESKPVASSESKPDFGGKGKGGTKISKSSNKSTGRGSGSDASTKDSDDKRSRSSKVSRSGSGSGSDGKGKKKSKDKSSSSKKYKLSKESSKGSSDGRSGDSGSNSKGKGSNSDKSTKSGSGSDGSKSGSSGKGSHGSDSDKSRRLRQL